jgi:hypothetical protein
MLAAMLCITTAVKSQSAEMAVFLVMQKLSRKQRRPVGRSSSYRPEYFAKIIRAMVTGLSAEATTANVGIPARQIAEPLPQA